MSRSASYQSRSLFIRFIPNDTRPDDLRNLFNKYGRVKDVYIPRDYYTRKLRGFAYVEFEKIRDAENTMRHASRIRLFGKELEVEFAQGDRKTPSEMRVRYSSKSSSSHRSHRSSGRLNESPVHIGQRERSRTRSDHRRYMSRSRSRSPSIRRHRRSFTPEMKIKKNHSYEGEEIERRYQKNEIDMIDGVIPISELNKF